MQEWLCYLLELAEDQWLLAPGRYAFADFRESRKFSTLRGRPDSIADKMRGMVAYLSEDIFIGEKANIGLAISDLCYILNQ